MTMATRGDVPLKDVRVRQAIAYCIDYKALLLGVFQSEMMGGPPTSIFHTGFQYAIDLGPYEYNVEKAKQLMAEAGYSKDNPVRIKGMSTNNVNNQTTAQIVQGFMKEIGVEMSLDVVDSSGATHYTNDPTVPAEYDLYFCSTTYGTGDPDYVLTEHETYTDITQASGMQGVEDERFNALAKEGAASTDEARRTEIYKEIQELVYDQCWWVPLLTFNSSVFCHTYLQNTQLLSGYAPQFSSWKIAQ
jgi:ABC-type transport system substrate-binding protein